MLLVGCCWVVLLAAGGRVDANERRSSCKTVGFMDANVIHAAIAGESRRSRGGGIRSRTTTTTTTRSTSFFTLFILLCSLISPCLLPRRPPTTSLVCVVSLASAYARVGFLYAGLVISGGAMGYIKKGSVPSLAAGGISGLLAGYGAYVSCRGAPAD